jgi:TctA family transporter
MEMSLLDAAIKGLTNILHLKVFLAMMVGVGIGTFTAVAPQGLGMPLVYAILLPVVVRWEPVTGMALLIGASSVSAICAAYLPILFGIPGGSGSQATVLDGYPMGKRGEGRRALGASFMAGGMGCLVGTFTLALAIPAAQPLIYLMGAPELFVVVLWGLSMVAVLAGRRPIKGLIAAVFGLLIATVGQQGQSGIMRFVFDQPYLLDGIPLSIIALALFGIPSALDLALTKIGVEQQPAPLKGSLLDGVKDTLREWWLVLRCSFIGVWVGIVPGIGSQVVDWLAYGHAAQTSKDATNFGKGDVRGVIAPESANNAKEGGALVPTVAFGVPGSASMAILLGAFLIHGLVPGPAMLSQHLDVTYAMVWSVALANIVGAGLCFLFSGQFAKLATLRYTLILPAVMCVLYVGAFQGSRDWGDLYTLLLLGVVGWTMKQLRWPRPPLILGFVLGAIIERTCSSRPPATVPNGCCGRWWRSCSRSPCLACCGR